MRTNRDDRYFTDTYQVMPLHGYTRMFERMLSHPNIKILLNADYREIQDVIPHAEVIFTGPVDEFFDYRFGKLPYRSLEFKFETRNVPVAQPGPVINYPNENAYTRVTEFKYLTGQEHAKTTLVYEYAKAEGDPYYPVPRPENAALYKQYQELAERHTGRAFPRPARHLQVLQHGPGRRAGADALYEADRIIPSRDDGQRRMTVDAEGRTPSAKCR